MTQWSETLIAGTICRQVLDSKCIVLVPNCGWTGHECDVLGVTRDLRIIDVEVKISRADLKADAKKDKWWRYLSYDEKLAAGIDHQGKDWWSARERALWPCKVWKHYYCLPRDIWKPELVECLPSPASGVLLMHESSNKFVIRCERRATPARDADRLTPAQAVDVARLANLRMWDALRNLEARAA